LIADEPTTALDPSLRIQILDLLKDLQEDAKSHGGMAVILITHDLNMVRHFAQRVAVMYQGKLLECKSTEEVFSHPDHPYTNSLVNSKPVRNVLPLVPIAPVLLKAEQVSVAYPQAGKGTFGRGIAQFIRGFHFSGLWKREYQQVVKDVSLELRQGETLGLIGESGSGKTTLALAALGLMPSEGTLTIDGAAWQGKAAQDLPLRRKVQVVFQDPFSSLSPRMNVQELVSEGLTLHAPQLDELGRLRRILVTLAAVGLTETEFPGLLQRYAHEFSGGQRQRLAIARALVVEPQVLVLDEPTSALDATTQLQVLQLLQKLQRERGLSYLLITHDVSVIRAMAHHVMVMQAGKVVEMGTFEQVLNNPQAPYTKILVGADA
jgi:microcin C transport system ATP-binding protein